MYASNWKVKQLLFYKTIYRTEVNWILSRVIERLMVGQGTDRLLWSNYNHYILLNSHYPFGCTFWKVVLQINYLSFALIIITAAYVKKLFFGAFSKFVLPNNVEIVSYFGWILFNPTSLSLNKTNSNHQFFKKNHPKVWQ